MADRNSYDRIIQRNRYNPVSLNRAQRKVRVIGTNGATQTYKRAGDLVLDSSGTRRIEQEGFQS